MIFAQFCRTLLNNIFWVNNYLKKKNEKGHKSNLINVGIHIN